MLSTCIVSTSVGREPTFGVYSCINVIYALCLLGCDHGEIEHQPAGLLIRNSYQPFLFLFIQDGVQDGCQCMSRFKKLCKFLDFISIFFCRPNTLFQLF